MKHISDFIFDFLDVMSNNELHNSYESEVTQKFKNGKCYYCRKKEFKDGKCITDEEYTGNNFLKSDKSISGISVDNKNQGAKCECKSNESACKCNKCSNDDVERKDAKIESLTKENEYLHSMIDKLSAKINEIYSLIS